MLHTEELAQKCHDFVTKLASAVAQDGQRDAKTKHYMLVEPACHVLSRLGRQRHNSHPTTKMTHDRHAVALDFRHRQRPYEVDG